MFRQFKFNVKKKRREKSRLFFMCALQGADTWECKSPVSLVRGITSGRQGCSP
jgi:hypothetical protein